VASIAQSTKPASQAQRPSYERSYPSLPPPAEPNQEHPNSRAVHLSSPPLVPSSAATSPMAWRHISTVALVGTILVAAALLATAHPTAVIPALPVGAPAPTPMADARPDSSADEGIRMTSTLEKVCALHTAADLANAVRGCTKHAPLCLRPAPKNSLLDKLRACLKGMNSCGLATVIAPCNGRSVAEQKRWLLDYYDCSSMFHQLS